MTDSSSPRLRKQPPGGRYDSDTKSSDHAIQLFELAVRLVPISLVLPIAGESFLISIITLSFVSLELFALLVNP